MWLVVSKAYESINHFFDQLTLQKHKSLKKTFQFNFRIMNAKINQFQLKIW